MNTEELRIYLRTVADTKGVQQTEAAVRGLRGMLTTTSALGDVISDTFQEGMRKAVDILRSSIEVLRDHERIVRATAMAYGSQAEEFTKFAGALERQTGFASDAILEAALSARTLSQNYGLSIQQTQNLIKASADLARVRGIGLFEAFERVQSAIRGEAEASEYLGLTLNDTYLRNQAMNGSLRNTFEKLTDVEKAQIRYAELLKQSAQFAGLAKTQTESLDAAFTKAGTSARNLQITLGDLTKPAVISGLKALAFAADALNEGLRPKDPEAIRFWRIVRDVLRMGGAGIPGAGTRVRAEEQAEQRLAAAERTQRRLRDLNQGVLAGDTRTAEQRRKDFEAELDRYRKRQAIQGAAQRRLAEINEMPVPAAQATARIAFLDQVDAAVRDIVSSQERELDLRRESVDLAAQEATLRLSMLPAQQRMTELQRQMTEQQIAARRAALPATEALEDLRYLQQRAQLISQNRNVAVEERIAARRQLREIGRGLPGAELAALEAGRGVTLAERAATRFGMEQQLFEIANQRQLEQITQAQATNGWLQQIAGQQTQAIELTINLGTEEFQTEVFKQLVEAEKQAQGPTVVKLSGVRRG